MLIVKYSPNLVRIQYSGNLFPGLKNEHGKLVWGVILGIALCLLLASNFALVSFGQAPLSVSSNSGGRVLIVPSMKYPTIQSAINAATGGDTVFVKPGTYTEQLEITKSITLLGSGASLTSIKEPRKLAPDSFGSLWGVHIGERAVVSVSGFAFKAQDKPYDACIGATAVRCATIAVDDGATLYLNSVSLEYLNELGRLVTTDGLFVGLSRGPCSFAEPICAPLSIGHAFVSNIDVLPPASISKNATGVAFYVADGSDAEVSYSKIVSTPTFGSTSGAFYLQQGSKATIFRDDIVGGMPILMYPYSQANISYNTIGPTGLAYPIGGSAFEIGVAGIIVDYSTHTTITYNDIIGGPNVVTGISLTASQNSSSPTFAVVAHNAISNILCTNLAGLKESLCGPNYFTQYEFPGIVVSPEIFTPCGCGTYPQTTYNIISIKDNFILNTDNGIALTGVQNCCAVSNNVIYKSTDYAILATDGRYTFSNTIIVGATYGVSAVAGLGSLFGQGSSNTKIIMVGTVIEGISVSRTFLQTASTYTAKVIFKS